MKQLIECVPNFSEGRDLSIIKQITDVICSVQGVVLLNVDPGYDTNRTVVTFAGEPGPVVEAAFLAVKCASEIIDMRHHSGEHPRFGATDVCPLVPVSNITMEETVVYARALAKRVGDELAIPVFCYEFAAFEEKRRSLANCRSGEYEGLPKKLRSLDWKPDFGPAAFNERAGAVAIGARNFLIAYNINLDTTSVAIANAIAVEVRESGTIKREGDPITGTIIRDEHGNPIRIPGRLKKVRAIGWFIKEYGVAQISMNLIDIAETPIHVAFVEVCERAQDKGVKVTGSELIGMVPLQALIDAGKYFARQHHRSSGVPDRELINIAVKSLGLDELAPFDPEKRVIEYVLDNSTDRLINFSLRDFIAETASDTPAPGGGSVAAAIGALGAALGVMVATLSAKKRGWENQTAEFSSWAEEGKRFYTSLLQLVDQDTDAFTHLMEAYKLPKGSPEAIDMRKNKIQTATRNAIEIPFKVMQVASESFSLIEEMTKRGNPNSITDAAVGALCAAASVSAAYLNVKVNASAFEDKEAKRSLLAEAEKLNLEAKEWCERIQSFVYTKLDS
jgi:glutamate formiminotransferase / formiminotetrahydrofolate cyclodeaminase